MNFLGFKLASPDKILDLIRIYFCVFSKNKKIYFFIIIFNILRYILLFVGAKVAFRRIYLTMFGELGDLHKLNIYFNNLVNDTIPVDFWFKKNNLLGLEFSGMFTKILFLIDTRYFNLKRRAWHSFYKRFFDLLKFIKFKMYNKGCYRGSLFLNQFYRIFFKFMVFVKYSRFEFRKKSFKKKPLRYGNQVFL